MAIEQALQIINWFENLQKDEQPPEYLWEDDKGLELWWATVKAKRDDGRDTSGGHSDHAQTDQAPAMVTNDHARAIREVYA